MPILIVRSLESEERQCLLGVDFLKTPYPQFMKDGMGIRCFLNRVYSEKGKQTLQPKKTFIFKIIKPNKYASAKLDLTPFAFNQGIPRGYWVEILATNFVSTQDQSGKQKVTEFPIYPKEIKLDIVNFAPYSLQEQIKKEIETLNKIGEAFETVGSLYQAGFDEIASDLTEGLLRMENNDHEGALKFFRKVIEALRTYVKKPEVIVVSANRKEVVKRFLSSSFSLLSNFGEHAGTHGWVDESTLAKEVTIATIRYILSALK